MNNDTSHKLAPFKIVLLVAAFLICLILLSSIVLYQIALNQVTSNLDVIASRVKEDLSYSQGKWNTSRYDADPQLPETFPLYVLSTDGYVVDRWKPLHGFLDTSDIEKLLAYEKIQTVVTESSQRWRIYSKRLTTNSRTSGVVTVAKYDPDENSLITVDAELLKSMSQIVRKLSTKNGVIQTSSLDPRDVPYDISFQIVDSFNHILSKNNNTNSIDRLPNYLDSSYVSNIISGPKVRQIRDSVTNKPYILVTREIVDSKNYVIGVIVAGRSISDIYAIIQNFIIFEIVGSTIMLVLAMSVFPSLLKRFISLSADSSKDAIHAPITRISFNKKSGVLLFNEFEVSIPYATNQFYLCEALFSSPKKRWEIDELLEKFGEQDLKNWRKIYDAMTIVNKKTSEFMSEKLIVLQQKTYQLNPSLSSKIG
jgi:hypothetical protein